MNEYQANDIWLSGNSGTEAPSGRPAEIGTDRDTTQRPAPRFNVLTQIPDVADETAAQPATHIGGRFLSPGLSARLLLGGGLALFLIAALPFLFRSKDPGDSASRDEAPAFQPQAPAPDAPLAPKWEGKAGQGLKGPSSEFPSGEFAQDPRRSVGDPAAPFGSDRGAAGPLGPDADRSAISPTSRRVTDIGSPGPAPATPVSPGPRQYPSTDNYPSTTSYPNTATYPSTDGRAATPGPRSEPDYRGPYRDVPPPSMNHGTVVGRSPVPAERYDPRGYQAPNRPMELSSDPNAVDQRYPADYRRDGLADPRSVPPASDYRREYPVVRRNYPETPWRNDPNARTDYQAGRRVDPGPSPRGVDESYRNEGYATGPDRDPRAYDPAAYRATDPAAYRPADPTPYRPGNPEATRPDPRATYQADRRSYDPNYRSAPDYSPGNDSRVPRATEDRPWDGRGTAYPPADTGSRYSPSAYGDRYATPPATPTADPYYPAAPAPRVADQRDAIAAPYYVPVRPPLDPPLAEEPGVARFRGTIEKPAARSTNDGARSGIY